MRILIISNYYPPFELGGWEQLTQDVSDELRSRGHSISVLTSNYRADEVVEGEADVARVLHLESPDHVHYHPNYILQQRQRQSENRSELADRVKHFDPDIIFINGMWNLPVSVAAEAEQLLPGRVVYYVASSWPLEVDAHRAYWSSPTSRAWLRPFKDLAGGVLQRAFLKENRRNELKFEHVLCVSEYIRELLIQEAGILREQTAVVYNGVDPADFAMRSVDECHEPIRLLYAGQVVPHKGVHSTIEAMDQLQREEPDLPVELSIVGGGPLEYERYLTEMVATLCLSDKVHFLGKVARAEMPLIMQRHDVALVPTITPEPLARVIQEAMACGLVVIASTTGGSPEIVKDGESGLTFQAGDACMLAECIGRVVRERELRSRLARAARELVEEQFSFSRMVDEIEGYFGHLLI